MLKSQAELTSQPRPLIVASTFPSGPSSQPLRAPLSRTSDDPVPLILLLSPSSQPSDLLHTLLPPHLPAPLPIPPQSVWTCTEPWSCRPALLLHPRAVTSPPHALLHWALPSLHATPHTPLLPPTFHDSKTVTVSLVHFSSFSVLVICPFLQFIPPHFRSVKPCPYGYLVHLSFLPARCFPPTFPAATLLCPLWVDSAFLPSLFLM